METNQILLPESVDLISWPSMPGTDHKKFPKVPAIYVAYYCKAVLDYRPGHIIYIGRTKSLRQRFSGYCTHNCLKQPCIRIAWLELPPEYHKEIEKRLIQHHQPDLNVHHHKPRVFVEWGSPEWKKLMSS